MVAAAQGLSRSRSTRQLFPFLQGSRWIKDQPQEVGRDLMGDVGRIVGTVTAVAAGVARADGHRLGSSTPGRPIGDVRAVGKRGLLVRWAEFDDGLIEGVVADARGPGNRRRFAKTSLVPEMDFAMLQRT